MKSTEPSTETDAAVSDEFEKPLIAGTDIYKLGQIAFTVSHCDQNFINDLRKVLPKAPANQAPESIVEIRMGCVGDVRQLANNVLKRHYHCLWMDAACLISPSGKKVLVCGKSHSGKSTLAMALALGYGWKLLAEDIALIEPKTGQIICFASPFSLKAGTAALLKKTVGTAPDEIVLKEWSLMTPYAETSDQFAPFDIAVNMELKIERKFEHEPLQTNQMSSPEFIRCLLPLSNLVRKNATELFSGYVESAQRHHVSGGSLLERLKLFHDICEEPWIEPKLKEDENPASVPAPAAIVTNGTQIFKRNQSVKTEILNDGYCVISNIVGSEFAFTLAPLGSIIWELSDGLSSVDTIVTETAKLAGVSKEEVHAPVYALIEELAKASLLQAVD